jgi:hypothetical protein
MLVAAATHRKRTDSEVKVNSVDVLSNHDLSASHTAGPIPLREVEDQGKRESLVVREFAGHQSPGASPGPRARARRPYASGGSSSTAGCNGYRVG